MKGGAVVTIAAPSIGPVIVAMTDGSPVLALGLSIAGLLLARVIAPPPLRKLTRMQNVALTCLLAIFLFLIVTGEFGNDPLEPGMAVVWGVGLGFSGLMIVEIFAERVRAMIRAMIGHSGRES